MRSVLMLSAFVLLVPTAWASSPCSVTSSGGVSTLTCANQSTTISSSYGIPRTVSYSLPGGTPPAGGWPAVIWYQGTSVPISWTAQSWMTSGTGGLWYQVSTIQDLLDHGYAVVSAPVNPFMQAYTTNFPGVDTYYSYTMTDDYGFINNVLNAVSSGGFGPINSSKLYATGISSGGYNTSRMAVSFQGRFRSLVVDSGSYANCVGPFCTIPNTLPYNHPPTRFIHGQNDPVVPIGTMQAYYGKLVSQGIPTDTVIDPAGTHEWLSEMVVSTRQWFDTHP